MKTSKKAFALTSLLLVAGMLAACNPGEKHTHNFSELIAKVDATCEAAGMNAYYTCDGCDKVFDADKNETTLEDLVIAAKGHDLTSHSAVAPTCTENGNVAYWECKDCEKKFSDAQGTTLITNVVDPAIGHDYEVAWSWESDKSKATATFTCKHEGCSDVQTVVDEDIEKVTVAPGYGVDGKDTYKASVTFAEQTYEDTKEVAVVATLKVEKGKTERAAIDNMVTITEAPVGTAKVQYSKDGGTNWADVVDKKLDYTTLNKVDELKFKALNASDEAIGDVVNVAIDKTWYAGGDAYVNANNNTGIAVSASGLTTSKPVVASFWSADTEGEQMPPEAIMYKCPSTTKTANSFHAVTKLSLSSAAKSDVDAIIPGATSRMYVNNDATGYKTAIADEPYGIKKVASWVFFSNFKVKLDNEETIDIEKVYNNGFFMTPVSGTSAVTGYYASANPFEVVENGYAEKTWVQIVEDLSSWTHAVGCGNTTGYFSFTNSVSLGSVTGLAADMSTSLLGATYQGHTVTDFSFDIGMNALQFIL